MSITTLPTPLAERGVTCALCSTAISDVTDAVLLADLSFHSGCAPRCELCGRGLKAELEADWTYQVQVIWSVYGYERIPLHHLCADCRDTGLFDEPSAQD